MKMKFDGDTIKQGFLNHFEKLLFGCVVLFFLFFVYLALGRERLPFTPEEMRTQTENAKARVRDAKPNPPTPNDYMPAVQPSTTQVNESRYQFDRVLNPRIFTPANPRGMPEVFAIEGLKGSAGNGAFAMADASAADSYGGTAIKGQRWVCLVGLVPWKKQLEAYKAKFEDTLPREMALQPPEYAYYRIERAQVDSLDESAEPNWDKATRINVRLATQMAELWRGMGASLDIAPNQQIDPTQSAYFTFPLPPLQAPRTWGNEVAYPPEIPLAVMAQGEPSAGAEGTDKEGKKGEGKSADGKEKAPAKKAPPRPVRADEPDEPDAAGPGGMAGMPAGMPGMPGGMPGGAGMGKMMGGGMPGGMPGGAGMGKMMGSGMPGGMPGGAGMGKMMGSGMPGGAGMGKMMGSGMPGGMPGSAGMGKMTGSGMPGSAGMGKMTGGYPGMGGMGGMSGYPGMGTGYEGATVEEPQYKLFRFFDFSVEPGKHYRYRVRLLLANPNQGLPPQYVADESFVKGRYNSQETTPWSRPTPVITVPYDAQVFVTANGVKLNDGSATLMVVNVDPKDGATSSETLTSVQRGELLNYRDKKFNDVQGGSAGGGMGMMGMMSGMMAPGMAGAAAPTDAEDREKRKVNYMTEMVYMDFAGGRKLLGGSGSVEPVQLLFFNHADGRLIVRNEIDDKPDVTAFTPQESAGGAMATGGYGPTGSMPTGSGGGYFEPKKGAKGGAKSSKGSMGMMPGMGGMPGGMGMPGVGIGDMDSSTKKSGKKR